MIKFPWLIKQETKFRKDLLLYYKENNNFVC